MPVIDMSAVWTDLENRIFVDKSPISMQELIRFGIASIQKHTASNSQEETTPKMPKATQVSLNKWGLVHGIWPAMETPRPSGTGPLHVGQMMQEISDLRRQIKQKNDEIFLLEKARQSLASSLEEEKQESGLYSKAQREELELLRRGKDAIEKILYDSGFIESSEGNPLRPEQVLTSVRALANNYALKKTQFSELARADAILRKKLEKIATWVEADDVEIDDDSDLDDECTDGSEIA